MTHFSWKQMALASVMVLALGSLISTAFAEEDDWNFPDPDATSGYQQYQPYQAPPSYAPTYQPYPAQLQPAPVQQPRQSFLGKLLSPLFKRMSPPIQQVPKVVKEKPRETVALKDPLIRLGRSIEYEGQRVPPGFYLLSLQGGSSEDGAMLTIKRQQQSLLSVPALSSQTYGASSASNTEPTLPTPPNKTGNKEKAQPPEATALVELASDGQTVLLVYQQDGKKYTSRPMAVVP